jgi:hypothetical protein
MVSKFAILSSFLLASVALAAPSSRLEARLTRRRENRRSQPISRLESPAGTVSDVEYSSNWAGAVWGEGDVRITPLIHDHLQSHHFANRELSPLSLLPSLSPPLQALAVPPLLGLVSTVTPVETLSSRLASTSQLPAERPRTMVRDVEPLVPTDSHRSFVE